MKARVRTVVVFFSSLAKHVSGARPSASAFPNVDDRRDQVAHYMATRPKVAAPRQPSVAVAAVAAVAAAVRLSCRWREIARVRRVKDKAGRAV